MDTKCDLYQIKNCYRRAVVIFSFRCYTEEKFGGIEGVKPAKKY